MMRRFLSVCFALLIIPAALGAQVGNFSKLVLAVDARTIASNGGGTAATLTLIPLGSYVAITCNDPDTCAVTMGETGIQDGMPVTIVNMSTNAVTFADTAGVTELTGAASLSQYSTLTMIYRSDRWVEVSRSSGSGAGTVTPTGSPASGNLTFFSGATSITSGNLSGEVTTSGTGAVTITNNAVTNARLRDSGALSVIGRSANSTGDPADISASAASDAVLRESGSTLGFGTVATAGIADGAVTLAKIVDASAATRVLCRGSSGGSGDWEECTLGTNLSMGGTVINSSTSGTGVFTASIYLQYRDEKAQNTAGGTCTSGAWRTRDLNTEVADAGGLGTLGSNQITLTAGTYLISATAPAFFVNSHQTRLQNVTDATTVLLGTVDYTGASNQGSQSSSMVKGIFTIAASKALELQQQCQATRATDGFGVQGNFTTEVYSVVELWKIG